RVVRLADGRSERAQPSPRSAFPRRSRKWCAERPCPCDSAGWHAVGQYVPHIAPPVGNQPGYFRRQHRRVSVMRIRYALCLIFTALLCMTALIVAATETRVADAAMNHDKDA